VSGPHPIERKKPLPVSFFARCAFFTVPLVKTHRMGTHRHNLHESTSTQGGEKGTPSEPTAFCKSYHLAKKAMLEPPWRRNQNAGQNRESEFSGRLATYTIPFKVISVS